MINLECIKALNPCKDRINNYENNYGTRDFSPSEFLSLENITHSDKLWVAFRMLPRASVVKAAVEIAQSVLHIYESKYPGDSRVRDCINATLAGTVTREQRNAAYAASYAAAATYAANASYAAAYAASYAATAAYAAYAAADYVAHARAAASAATDATIAAAAAAATAATAASAATDATRKTQEDVNLSIVLKHWKNV